MVLTRVDEKGVGTSEEDGSYPVDSEGVGTGDEDGSYPG